MYTNNTNTYGNSGAVDKILFKSIFFLIAGYYLLVLLFDVKSGMINYDISTLFKYFVLYGVGKFAVRANEYRFIRKFAPSKKEAIVTVIAIILDMILLGCLSLVVKYSIGDLFMTFAPGIIGTNILINHLSKNYEFETLVIYTLFMEFGFMLLPIYPDTPFYILSLGLLIFPLIIMLFLIADKDIINKFGNQNDFSHILIFVIVYAVVAFSLITSNKSIYKVSVMNNNSMAPNISQGDLLIIKESKHLKYENLKENDVVQFNYKGYILTHRIIEVKDKNDELKFVTKGDNNQNTDFPDTEKYQIISKVEYIVPAIGDFVALIKKDLG